MARKEHPLYENAEWPDYEFREFPMMVYPGARSPKNPEYFSEDDELPRGKHVGDLKFVGVIVQNDEELDRVLGGAKTVTEAGVTRVRTEEDDRQALIVKASQMGIQVDRRWGVSRLQTAIDEASAVV